MAGKKYIIEEGVLDDLVARVAGLESAIGPPPKPLHEMTEAERTAYANETWAKVLSRPARGAR